MIDVNMKPLADRQREVDEAILRKLGREEYLDFKNAFRGDVLKWRIIPLILGRDLWDRFWAVYRDSVEESANRLLTRLEESKKKPPSIFGGFDAG